MTLIRTGTLLDPNDEDVVRYSVGGTFVAAQVFQANALSIGGPGGGSTTINTDAEVSRVVVLPDASGDVAVT